MGDGCCVKGHDDGDRLGRILGRVDGLGGDSDDRVQGYDASLILEHVRDGCPARQRSGRLHSDCVTLGVIPDELAARFWWKEEWRILPVIEVHDQHAACQGSLAEDRQRVESAHGGGGMMLLRAALAAALVFALLAAPLATRAQQTGKMPRIGILHVPPPPSPFFEMLREGLRDLGYIEGQNIAFEFRSAEGKLQRLPTLAADLVHLNVGLIVTATAPAARAAKDATTAIPIVMVGVNYDPMALGYVASHARPGGNVTGLFFLHLDLMAKRLGVFKEMLPTVSRVTVLSDPYRLINSNRWKWSTAR
jgi:hypothetical protein